MSLSQLPPSNITAALFFVTLCKNPLYPLYIELASFTITKETMLSDITTSIHDPDGTFAVINDNSGVIYKIERQRPAPPQIIQEILKEEKKKK